MRTIFKVVRPLVLTLFVLASLVTSTRASEVLIPDPGLNAAIRAALHRPAGPLTEQDLLGLTNLDASSRSITNLQGLESARNLVELDLEDNQLTSFSFPSNLTSLEYLDLSANSFTNLFFPDGLTNLTSLIIESSRLTDLTLPAGMTGLIFLELNDNLFTNLTFPTGLTNLNVLSLQHNLLTSFTLPPQLTRLTTVLLGGNPLESLVLSEPAATNLLAGLVASLRSGGVSVFTYPLTPQLVRPRPLTGAFQFGITGPPGVYSVLGSTDLAAWSEVGMASNTLGSINFTDVTANSSPQKFYRALRFDPPANMD